MSSTPTPEQRDPVVLMIEGLAGDVDLDELREQVGRCFTFGDAVSARGLLELAAAAFLACGASPSDPIVFDELEERYLPGWDVRGRSGHEKRRYALTAAVLLAAGVEPENTSWWRVDNLWSYAFDAVVAFVRAASERRQLPIATICLALPTD